MDNSTTPLDGKAMPPASAGSVSVEPVAWSIQWHGENRPDGHWTYEDKHTAEICLAGCGSKGVVVPLYRSPTLTDAEREALEWACRLIASTMPYESQHGAEDYQALRGLLERLGGER